MDIGQAIEIHPLDLAELAQSVSKKDTFPYKKLGEDLHEVDGIIYHQNAHIDRKPGPHTIE